LSGRYADVLGRNVHPSSTVAENDPEANACRPFGGRPRVAGDRRGIGLATSRRLCIEGAAARIPSNASRLGRERLRAPVEVAIALRVSCGPRGIERNARAAEGPPKRDRVSPEDRKGHPNGGSLPRSKGSVDGPDRPRRRDPAKPAPTAGGTDLGKMWTLGSVSPS